MIKIFASGFEGEVLTFSLFVIPATIGAMCFAEPVVKLLFGRGAFDSKLYL